MNRCEFSFEEATALPLQERMTYAAQCPLCGSVRTSLQRAGYRVFPQHEPPMGPPRDVACWKRDDSGIWHWHWWMPKPKEEEQG